MDMAVKHLNQRVTNGRALSRSMPVIAKVVCRQFGVKVFFDAGDVPFANPDGIHLPASLKSVGTQRDAMILNGFLDHEAAHVRYTEFGVMLQCRTPFEKSVLNILEDIRIERKLGECFPGCKLNLAATTLLVDGEGLPNESDPPDLTITNWLVTYLRKHELAHQVHDVPFDERAQKILGKKLRDDVMRIARQGTHASNTLEVLHAAQKIVDLLQKTMKQQQKMDQQQQPQQQGAGNGQGQGSSSQGGQNPDSSQKPGQSGSSGGADDSTAKDGKQEGAGTQPNGNSDGKSDASAAGKSAAGAEGNTGNQDATQPGKNQGSDQGSGKESGAGQSQGASQGNGQQSPSGAGQGQTGSDQQVTSGTGKSQDQAGTPQLSSTMQSGAGTGNGSQAPLCDAKAVAQALSGAGGDKFAEALKAAMQKLVGKDKNVVEDEDIRLDQLKHRGRYVCADTQRGVRIVSNKLDALLWSKLDEHRYTTTAGKLMPDLVANVHVGSDRIFEKRDEAEGLNTSMFLLYDVSGSMGVPGRKAAIQTTAIVAEACSRYDVPIGAAAFDNRIFPIKDFAEDWRHVGVRVEHVVGGGGTLMAAVLAWAIEQIAAERTERKIILLATDGQPASKENLAVMVEEAARYDIEVRVVLIGQSEKAAQAFHTEISYATHVSAALTHDDIPKAILACLQGGQGL
jgi:hypothetical protein